MLNGRKRIVADGAREPIGNPPVPHGWPRRLVMGLLGHPAWTASGVIFLFAAASLFDIIVLNTNLNFDEAYYWEWSRRLGLGYYTKPPLIAYINAAATALLGHHEWVLRSAGLLQSVLTLAVAYLLGRELGRGSRTPAPAAGVTGLAAVCGLLALPEYWGTAMVADTNKALFLCWLLSILAYLRASAGERRWWYFLGVALGFGLLAKYTMLLLLAALATHLLLFERRWLRTRYPWLAMGMAVLMNAGVIWWNCMQHWAVVGHYGNLSSHDVPHPVLHFLAQQLLVASPLFIPLMVYAVILMNIAIRRDKRAALLFLATAPVFAFSVAVACNRPAYPHWAFPAYLAAAPAVAWVATTFSPVYVPMRRTMRVWFAVAFFAVFAVGMIRMPGERVEGNAMAQRIAPHVAAQPNPPFVFSHYREICALAAFYLPGQPRVYSINLGFREGNQYDVWGGWDELAGRDGLFVCYGDAAQVQVYANQMVARGVFESAQLLETSQFRMNDEPIVFSIVLMRHFNGEGRESAFLQTSSM